MKCKQQVLMEQGKLTEQAWQQHAKECPSCRETHRLHEALGEALQAPAAPADLVDKVFARTTRRPSWLVRWRTVLAGSMVAVLVAAGAVYHTLQPRPFSNAELVAYMYQTETDEYGTFLSDLTIFEQEF